MMIGAEPLSGYKCGGYHPVHLCDKLYGDRFTILHKLGWGSYATIWLARDSAVLEPCVDVPDLNNTEWWTPLLRRYVALKIIVARLVNTSNEINILQYLRNASKSRIHPGSDHVLGHLDNFRVAGPNGTHHVLVFDVLGSSPDELRNGNEEGEELVWKRSRIISKEVALGVAYLHELGVVHGGIVSFCDWFQICPW
jgi:serine/threonine-protein kinase SRPK3